MKLTRLAQAIALLGVGAAAFAQTAPETPAPAKLERVEITGSSIKRIQSEGALPIQTITREDIKKTGVVSAEQLLEFVSANVSGANNLSAQQGFVTSFARHNNGASSANLRGLGAGNTLVLLNGRRLSTHGLNGSTVDLNSVPLAMIERVEVLKDGASAIYGTDAIGGVINFILRKDYQGLEVTGFGDVTQRSGGNIYSGSVLGGVGALEADGYNVMASLSYDRHSKLRSSDRGFSNNGFQPERGLSPDTTGTPYATVRTGDNREAGVGSALSSFDLPSGSTVNKANLLSLQGKCNSVAGMSQYQADLWGNSANEAACAYDYGRDTVLQQPVDRTQLVSRGTVKLAPDHQAFAEVIFSRTVSEMEFVASQFTGNLFYPVGGAYYPTDLANAVNAISPGSFDTSKDVRVRWRCLECGPRMQETTTDAYRVQFGAEGLVFGDWDYKVGLSTAGSKADSIASGGAVFEDAFNTAFNSGVINPWLQPGQTQTPEARAAIDATRANGTHIFGGETTLVQFDGAVSGEIMKLPAGPLQLAVGYDVRRESYTFQPSDANQPGIKDVGGDPLLDKATRNIYAVYAELAIPIVQNLDAQVAVRYDHYSQIGGTTNPKVGLRWQPAPEVLFRTSYNTGFHAPDYPQLYSGEIEGLLNNAVADPACPLPAGDPNCVEKWDTREGGNPNLKPEKSTQWSLGVVFQPVDWFNASVDYFNIERTDRITLLDPRSVLENYDVLGENVIRNPDGSINYIRGGWVNSAGDKLEGFDISVNFNGAIAGGKWNAGIDGTYLKSFKTRLLENQPYTELVGEFGSVDTGFTDVYARWKHVIHATYSTGPWSTTLLNTYTSGYKDQQPLGTIPPGFDPDVKPYYLWHLSGTYTGIKNASFTAGVRNLFDKDPPFSAHNVDDVGGTGWDARVADPRGRSFHLRATYKFF